jgi:Cu(I)/Ag(I) efflux system membrane protein CusA/SilA
MVTAPLLSMFVVPAAYLLLRRRQTRRMHALRQVPATGERTIHAK